MTRTNNILARFEAKFIKNINGCWEWTASYGSSGHGKFGLAGKTVSAHRVSYFLYKGIIPENLVICHTCDNKKCVNPDHLFLGTRSDNMQDAVNKNRHFSLYRGKTHCIHGHEFTKENTYVYPKKNGETRVCKTCINRRSAA